jgi:hypothetical protein
MIVVTSPGMIDASGVGMDETLTEHTFVPVVYTLVGAAPADFCRRILGHCLYAGAPA